MTVVQTFGSTQNEVDDLMLDLLPRQGFWSEEKYLLLTDEANRLIEYTDGAIEVLPTPTDEHQSILAGLFILFSQHVSQSGGKVQFAPLRLRVDARRYREPESLLARRGSGTRSRECRQA